MKKVTQTIGIDVSKLTLDVMVRTTNVHKQFSNDTKGFKQIITWLSKQRIDLEQSLICFEHTGWYCLMLSYFLYENNLDMKHVMDKLGLNRICCRKTFMSDIVISFPRPDSEVAARLKKIIPELAEVEKNYLSGLSDKIRDKIIANSHKLDLPEPADLNPETELYTERLAEEDIGENYKIKSGFNVIGYESVGEGKYVEVLGASKLDNGLGVRTYLGR